MGTNRQGNSSHLQSTFDNKDKMNKILLVLFFSCCFAQEERTVNQDDDNIIPVEEIKELDTRSGENPSSEDGTKVGEILRELSAELNKDLLQTISVLLADMADMKGKMEELADTKVKLEQTREWLYKDL